MEGKILFFLRYVKPATTYLNRSRVWLTCFNFTTMKTEASHFRLSDEMFEAQFATAILPASWFNHEAHLRLAWIHLDKYGVEKAIENISDQLLAFVTALGAADKYNKTLTIAAIRAVYHFKLKSQSNNFQDFIAEFPRLKNNFRELIDSHYCTDIFKSEQAKREYLQPELLPFD
jgi:hypothetical protein